MLETEYCPRCAHTAHHRAACTAFHVAGQYACICPEISSVRDAITAGTVQYDFDSSMFDRYGPQWREMERGFRQRVLELIASSLRDCETWSQAGVDTTRFAEFLRDLQWLLNLEEIAR